VRPNLLIGLNNILAFISFNFFSLLFSLLSKKIETTNSLLIINTGTLGDVIISSAVIENFEKYNADKIYFLIDEQYSSLFSFDKPSIQIIPLDKKKYKYSYFYKYKILKKLNDLNCSDCYNLTSARGISSDELALLSGAGNVYCFASNWKSIVKIFERTMDRKYSSVLFPDIFNEYQKHEALISRLSGNNFQMKHSHQGINLECRDEYLFLNKKDYIVIAPFASDMIKSLGVKRYINLCRKLSLNHKVVLIGSESERKLLDAEFETDSNQNIFNLVGKIKLSHLPYLIYNSKLFIGNDSGLSHLALKLGVPLIANIGGGSYNRYFPYTGENAHYLFNCMDCFGCEWKCIHKEPYCLTGISDKNILAKVDEVLERSKTAYETT